MDLSCWLAPATTLALILSTIPSVVELLMTDFISASESVFLATGWKVDYPRRPEHSVNSALIAISLCVLIAPLMDRL